MRLRDCYKLKIGSVLLLAWLVVISAASANDDEPSTPAIRVIRVPKAAPGTEPLYDYITALLNAALEASSDKYGKVRLVASEGVTVQDRQLRNLEYRHLDVTWSVTSAERERYHRPIRVPILSGLFGQRVFFVHENDDRFHRGMTIQELKSLRAVQGQDWPDTRIFRHNGFHVVEGTYQSAFRMLSEHFVDYFPRGVLEIGYEANHLKDEPITIEPDLAIVYPSAMFFFVSKDNEKLAQRIEDGMESLALSGKLRGMLIKQPFYQDAMALMKGRQVFRMNNPYLSEESKKALEKYVSFTEEE